MRILLCSYWFHPSLGGVESISQTLAEQWSADGFEVTVVTNTPGAALDTPYRLVRRPGLKQLVALGRESDVIVQNIVALSTFVPLLLSGRPCIVIHNSWLQDETGKQEWKHMLKHAFLGRAYNVSVSKAIADSLRHPSQIIPNPFNTQDFSGLLDCPRTRDLVFMGRLVTDKGVTTLLEALSLLRKRGLSPSLTIIGDGPEMPQLRAITTALGLDAQVTFAGALRETRGQVVATHRIMVIPSRWAEPFGIVALEGIASGCAVVASCRGGLPEAVGPCGLLFENGDSESLAVQLERIIADPVLRQSFIDAGPEHLQRFSAARVAGEFEQLFQKLTSQEVSGGATK